MIGRTLGHYEIVALIGRGGMGEVYRARDTKLDREVALKVLPADVASDPIRLERFQREARTVAALNHPNIVTLYSVEEAAGVHFLTMELVDGQALDKMIPPDGMPFDRVEEIGVAISDALAAAHEKGIVHRDLKPANVMVTGNGRVKVLDFGLAKLAQPLSSRLDTQTSPMTRDGTVVGTVPYMSPEQVRGENVDARSDIFSMGSLLYQLITGRMPFHGEYDHAIAYAIVNEAPAPMEQSRNGVPAELKTSVMRCLEKEPSKRFQSAAVVRDGLQASRASGGSRTVVRAKFGKWTLWIGTAVVVMIAGSLALQMRVHAPMQETKSIAVLPFTNMSSDKDQEYFADGISEELLNLLAQVPSLKVAARTSSFSFKGKDVEVPEIARQLKVSHVLEGSVRKSGDRVRITAQLIHASDGYHVWSQTYDRTLNDIFAIQDEIAADVVKQLKVSLLGEAPKSRTTNPEAYALYMRGKQTRQSLRGPALATADSLFRLALKIDPQFAPAWDQLSLNLQLQAGRGYGDPAERFAAARDAADQALAIDPDFAPAHASLGRIAIWQNADFRAAAPHLQKALELDPVDPWVLSACAILLRDMDRLEESIAVCKFALERDPVSPSVLHALAHAQLLAGHYDDAIQTYRTTLNIVPDSPQEIFGLGSAFLMRGDAEQALETFTTVDDELFRLQGQAMANHLLGRKADSDAEFKSMLKYEKDASYNIACVCGFRGENDRTFEWLEKAVAYKDTGLSEIASDNLFNPINSDPRWLPFLRKIDKAPEQLAEIKFEVKLPGAPVP